MPRLFAILLAAASLGGCALHPLYAGGRAGTVGQTLAGISVAPIAGEQGWLLRNALNDRLGAAGRGAARYRLDVVLDDAITGYGVRSDDAVTRERRSLRARWQLVDTANGGTVLDATAGSDSGIDVVGSEYATIAAEHSALERLTETIADQIVARIGQYARTGGAAATGR